MRLYLVRRTRSFIQNNYAETDPETGQKYLTFEDGGRSYFPDRIPKTIRFDIDPQYARLFADDVVEAINGLQLPRYGLGNYITTSPDTPPGTAEQKILDDLSRAGKRLMGFCRTNLFKRLESSGYAFLLSVERHALRNFIFIHAIENTTCRFPSEQQTRVFWIRNPSTKTPMRVSGIFSMKQMKMNMKNPANQPR